MNYPTLLERFLTYVKVNTRSDEHSTIIFMHYWINIYNKYTVFPFFQKGHWMMAAMYIIYQMATLSALFLQMTQVSRAKLVSFPTWTQQISMQKVSIRKSLKIMMAV